jgi:putative membrane protein
MEVKNKGLWAVVIGLILLIAVSAGFFLMFRSMNFGYFPMMGSRHMDFGYGFPLFLIGRGIGTLLFLALIIGGIVWLTRGSSRGAMITPSGAAPLETPLDVLKRRYAAGEITKEQYAEMKKDIGE